jgi:alkanesulfonate monooxygenase SsuD/methylene tetrahydromethanopterin reductase-like flavin-dependent oxidoreductase (luciferase family)
VHTLVLYGHSARAEESLRETARQAREHGDSLTVLALAQQEPLTLPVKCDTRRGMWNEILRELAQEDLTRAYMAVDGDDRVELGVLLCTRGHPADALTAEALTRGADEIVLADPSHSGLRRRERRRLRRRSPLPVTG